MGFNERFLALRDLKARLIGSMAEEDARLATINTSLDVTEVLPTCVHRTEPANALFVRLRDAGTFPS